MSAKTINEENREARTLLMEAKSIYDKGDDATSEELDAAETKTLEVEKIVERLAKHAPRADALKSINRIENTIAGFERIERPPLGGSPRGSDGVGHTRRGEPYEIKTAGERFIEDDAFGSYLKTIAPHGHVPSRTAINSPPVEVKSLLTSAIDAAANRPLMGQADRRQEIVELGWASRIIRQLVTNLTTSSDSVEVVRELARENNAATVAEATMTSGPGGVKPESGLTWEVIQTPVQVIAHWIPASTRILADGRRLKGEIDAFLREGVEQELERNVMVGSGAGTDFTGVNNTPSILTQAFATSILVTTRKARTNLRLNGHVAPTAYVMHPSDWETVDLLMDGENRFHFGGPIAMGVPRLWGVPVVESEFQSLGFTILGRWSDAVVYDREQTTISMSNSHSDFFIRNLVAILAEMRAAFHVRRPKSFVRVALA